MVFMCDCTTGKWGIYPSGGKHKKAIILGSPSLPNIYRELFCKSLGLSVLAGDIDKMKEKSNGKMINIIKASYPLATQIVVFRKRISAATLLWLQHLSLFVFLKSLVPRPGVEPGRLAALVFETNASTNSAIWAESGCKVNTFFVNSKEI